MRKEKKIKGKKNLIGSLLGWDKDTINSVDNNHFPKSTPVQKRDALFWQNFSERGWNHRL